MILAAFFFALLRPIAFVPLDDRPVTRQLPVMLGAVAGRQVLTPPNRLLGNYLTPGQPDSILAWLNGREARSANAFAISTDMLAYGGLVASRVPAAPYEDAYFRLREFAQLRRQHLRSWIGAFGTIMRLAPTGVPALGAAQNFFAAYPAWAYLQQYANLHDPPLPSEEATAEHLRQLIGDRTLEACLATRARNYAVDVEILNLTARRDIDRVALGQDDAGPVGLHVKEVRALRAVAANLQLGGRASIEPGADELGMAMIAHALTLGAAWTPRVAVRYSTPSGASYNDPLEFVPVEDTIDALIALCGARRDDAAPDVTLYVRVPGTTTAEDDAFFTAMRNESAERQSVALADITFLSNSFVAQAQFAERLLASGVMSHLDAYASWNTNANTVGAALAEAIAAGAGRRTHSYNALAHAEFTFDRVVDDYAFHDYVRPDLNAYLSAHGTA